MKLNAGLQAGQDYAKISKQLERAKKQMKNCLSNDFTKDLEDGIKNINSQYATFQEAEMQSDPLLAHHFIKKECDIIMFNDSDVFVHCPSDFFNVQLQIQQWIGGNHTGNCKQRNSRTNNQYSFVGKVSIVL